MSSSPTTGQHAADSLLGLFLLACCTVATSASAQSAPPQSPPAQPSSQDPGSQDPPAEQQPPDEPEEESQVLEERRRGDVAPEKPEPEADPPWARVSWNYGPHFDLFHGDMSIIIGGRLHLDAAAFDADPDIEAAFGEPNPGVAVRRALLQTGGTYKIFEFNFWLNFTKDFRLSSGEGLLQSSPEFSNLFLGLFNVPIIGGLRAGYFREPFGLDAMTSSNDITFMERSLTDSAFGLRRNLGVMLHRRFTADDRITASLGVFQDMNNDLDSFDGYGVTGRFTAVPWLAEDGRRLLHLGAAASYRRPPQDLLRFFSKPESYQAQLLADTGNFTSEHNLRLGLEAAMVLGSFSLQSEYMWTRAEVQADTGNPEFSCVYAMASYVLTGEHRSYRKSAGAFGTVHPEHPAPSDGLGAWEATLRYSYLDLDSAGIEGGVLRDWTLGLNWHLNDHSRVMFNYIAAHPEGFGYEHILQARLQINF